MQTTLYVAKTPDEKGIVPYTKTENTVWKTLYHRQIELIKNRACKEYLEGIKILGLNADEIPQCPQVSQKMHTVTGWGVAPVKALISFEEFFDLLANKKFPAATFIRRPEEMDYLKEPDIFHEIFGHCPLLANQNFANFTQAVGKLGKTLKKEDHPFLARLYWFTVEFGLIQTPAGLRIYGGGILSSKTESVYALESPIPKRKPLDLLTALRMPYRYDELQKTYFIINSFEELYGLMDEDLPALFKKVRELGMLPNPHEAPAHDTRSC
ncbi:MAG TPA: phenylalanine 4-monooxygenase [Coxiellaceae bacterium]|nr:phenylalanine 4-monooxygenase [Coxiellaceae bacterium]